MTQRRDSTIHHLTKDKTERRMERKKDGRMRIHQRKKKVNASHWKPIASVSGSARLLDNCRKWKMFILQLSYSHRNVDTFHMLRRLCSRLPTRHTDVDYKFSSSLSISIMNERINIMHIAPAPLPISHVAPLSAFYVFRCTVFELAKWWHHSANTKWKLRQRMHACECARASHGRNRFQWAEEQASMASNLEN